MNSDQTRRDWNAQHGPVISPARRGPVAPRRSGKGLIIPLLYYLLAAAQLARYLGEHSPDPDADRI